jgi:hypothetical protein
VKGSAEICFGFSFCRVSSGRISALHFFYWDKPDLQKFNQIAFIFTEFTALIRSGAHHLNFAAFISLWFPRLS